MRLTESDMAAEPTEPDDDIFPVYCRKCKKVIARDAVFCPNCGHRQSLLAPSPDSAVEADPSAVTASATNAPLVAAEQHSDPTVPAPILALLTWLSPVGCVTLPLALIVVLGLGLFLGEPLVSFWPMLMGVAVGVVCLKQGWLTEQNRVTALLVSLSVGTILNILILTAPR